MALDPRQQLFKENYTNPDSETFSNAYRSALKAGFSEEYAQSITAKENSWMAEIVGDLQRLQKAEKVLDKVLTMDTEDDNEKLRIQVDVGKFVAKGMGKSKYSERQELTGKDGADLPTPILKLDVQRNDGDAKGEGAV